MRVLAIEYLFSNFAAVIDDTANVEKISQSFTPLVVHPNRVDAIGIGDCDCHMGRIRGAECEPLHSFGLGNFLSGARRDFHVSEAVHLTGIVEECTADSSRSANFAVYRYIVGNMDAKRCSTDAH